MLADGSLIDSPLLVNICLAVLILVILAVHLALFPQAASTSPNDLSLSLLFS